MINIATILSHRSTLDSFASYFRCFKRGGKLSGWELVARREGLPSVMRCCRILTTPLVQS